MAIQQPDTTQNENIGPAPEKTTLADSLVRLDGFTLYLGKRARFVFVSTVFNLIVSFSAVILVRFLYRGLLPFYETRLISGTFIAGAGCTCGWCLYMLYYYDRAKRRGDALFEEVSDELQWFIRTENQPSSEKGRSGSGARPDLEARIVLRTYAQSIDLPLTHGGSGVTYYAGLNIALLVIVAFFGAFPGFQ